MTSWPGPLLVVGVRWPAETFIDRKLRGLAAAGVPVLVATESPGGETSFRDGAIDVVRLGGARAAGRHLWRSATVRALRAALGAGRAGGDLRTRVARASRFAALATLRPAVVHFEWNAAAVAYLPLLDVWRCPMVVSCRGSQINVRRHSSGQEAYLAGLREVFRRAAAVHCVSQAIAREAEALGLDPARARVITPAVDPRLFAPRPQVDRAGPFHVISVGTLEWRKGLEYSLLAFRRLRDAGIDARYTIIGDGPERQRVRYAVHDLELQDHVTLAGRRSPDEVRATLAGADALMLTSLTEGIANVALEAMACAVPVVTSDVGGMGEAVRDGVEGRLVPARDPDGAAAALVELARKPARARAMGAAGRARVLERFTLDRQIDAFLELYRSVLAGAAAAATP
jgi:colanic acid/amylovoran biosynthesis glycosyltransferase